MRFGSHRLAFNFFFFRLTFKHPNSFIFGEYVSPIFEYMFSFESFFIALFRPKIYKQRHQSHVQIRLLNLKTKTKEKGKHIWTRMAICS